MCPDLTLSRTKVRRTCTKFPNCKLVCVLKNESNNIPKYYSAVLLVILSFSSEPNEFSHVSLDTPTRQEWGMGMGYENGTERQLCKAYEMNTLLAGPCERRTRQAFFTDSRNCTSYRMFPDYYCDGTCSGGGSNCCRPKEYYTRVIPVNCPPWPWYEDSHFPNQILKCSCTDCPEESGEGQLGS